MTEINQVMGQRKMKGKNNTGKMQFKVQWENGNYTWEKEEVVRSKASEHLNKYMNDKKETNDK
jgi:hypothetical protein